VGFRAAENDAIGVDAGPEARIGDPRIVGGRGRRLINDRCADRRPRAQALERLAGDAITAAAVNRVGQPPMALAERISDRACL
jgi:hypothetical protein